MTTFEIVLLVTVMILAALIAWALQQMTYLAGALRRHMEWHRGKEPYNEEEPTQP